MATVGRRDSSAVPKPPTMGAATGAPLVAWTVLPGRLGLHSSGALFQTLPRGGAELRNHSVVALSARDPCDGAVLPQADCLA